MRTFQSASISIRSTPPAYAPEYRRRPAPACAPPAAAQLLLPTPACIRAALEYLDLNIVLSSTFTIGY
jgi:hypothetical protein